MAKKLNNAVSDEDEEQDETMLRREVVKKDNALEDEVQTLWWNDDFLFIDQHERISYDVNMASNGDKAEYRLLPNIKAKAMFDDREIYSGEMNSWEPLYD